MTVISFIDPALRGCDLGFGSTGVAVELHIDDGAGDGIDGCMKPPAPGPSAAVDAIDCDVTERLEQAIITLQHSPIVYIECCSSEQR
jgi:hypothetical protein